MVHIHLSEDAFNSIKMNQMIRTFSQEQYDCAHQMGLVILGNQNQIQLGGNENILLGGMLAHSNNNIKNPKIATLSSETNNEVTIQPVNRLIPEISKLEKIENFYFVLTD